MVWDHFGSGTRFRLSSENGCKHGPGPLGSRSPLFRRRGESLCTRSGTAGLRVPTFLSKGRRKKVKKKKKAYPVRESLPVSFGVRDRWVPSRLSLRSLLLGVTLLWEPGNISCLVYRPRESVLIMESEQNSQGFYLWKIVIRYCW